MRNSLLCGENTNTDYLDMCILYTLMYVCVFMHVCTRNVRLTSVYMNTNVYIYMYTYRCRTICKFLYIHTPTHTHIYILHIPTCIICV